MIIRRNKSLLWGQISIAAAMLLLLIALFLENHKVITLRSLPILFIFYYSITVALYHLTTPRLSIEKGQLNLYNSVFSKKNWALSEISCKYIVGDYVFYKDDKEIARVVKTEIHKDDVKTLEEISYTLDKKKKGFQTGRMKTFLTNQL